MLNVKSLNRIAPGLGARILQIFNDSSISPYFVIENKDVALSAAIEYQDSNDGTTWTTIVGTSVSIPPTLSNGQVIPSVKRFIALFAQGNVLIDIHVARNYNGNPINID